MPLNLLDSPRPRKRLWKAALALGVVVAVAAAGFLYHRKKKREKPPGPEASLAAVSLGDLEVRFREIGEIDAKDSVDIASKVSGRISELFVDEGDSVEAGQKLAVVQPGKTEAERFRPSTVKSPLSGVLTRYIPNTSANESDAHFVKAGDYVTGLFESRNPTYLMTVADLRRLVMRLKISEMDIFKLREKMPVQVSIDALPETDFPAEITMISPKAERDSAGLKVFRVEVELKGKDPRLRPGITARVDALLQKKTGVLKLSRAGLFEEGGRTFVYLDVPAGKPRQVEVKTGLKTALDAEIIEGLKEGDKVHTEKPEDFEPLPEPKPEEEPAKKGPKSADARPRPARRAARA
ncbi:MAG: efflux RND transporter periplasmic adaptor subunit [Elusimicrobiota bacterium]